MRARLSALILAPFVSLVSLVSLILLPGCASKREATLRADWEKAARAAAAKTEDAAGDGDSDRADDDEILAAWQELDVFVAGLVDQVALGLATVSVTQLTETLCAEEPDVEQPAEGGPRVYHCTPNPPQTIDGHAMTLELGETGTVGLVITDLTDKVSQRILATTRERAAPWCEQPWLSATRADDATEEFHTCTVPEGPTLAVGRFPVEDRWQFSLVVLIPG